MARVIKIKELSGKNVASKEETELLRGKIAILNPEESEIAAHLEIKEKGFFGVRFK